MYIRQKNNGQRTETWESRMLYFSVELTPSITAYCYLSEKHDLKNSIYMYFIYLYT